MKQPVSFDTPELRKLFAGACRGSSVDLARLPPSLSQLVPDRNAVHRDRGSRSGVNQDPLHIRVRWTAECIATFEERAVSAMARKPPPFCKCRRCRLQRAARRLADLRFGRRLGSIPGPGPSGASYSWRDVWAEVPEAAFSGHSGDLAKDTSKEIVPW